MGSWRFVQTHSVNISAISENKGKTFILMSGCDEQGHMKITTRETVSFSVPFCLFLCRFPLYCNHTVTVNHPPQLLPKSIGGFKTGFLVLLHPFMPYLSKRRASHLLGSLCFPPPECPHLDLGETLTLKERGNFCVGSQGGF